MIEEIKQNSPKTWYGFIDFIKNNIGSTMILTDHESISGWLYKFFDEQNYCVMVTLSGRWFWRICSLEIPAVWSNLKTSGLSSRQKAEKEAFIKAFEILEEK